MKQERCIKLATWILLGIFAWFYCGNTLFLHSHMYEGHRIIHSHPYLPSDNHTHSSQAMQSIAALNATASAMNTPGQIELPVPEPQATELSAVTYDKPAPNHSSACSWRAPPVV